MSYPCFLMDILESTRGVKIYHKYKPKYPRHQTCSITISSLKLHFFIHDIRWRSYVWFPLFSSFYPQSCVFLFLTFLRSTFMFIVTGIAKKLHWQRNVLVHQEVCYIPSSKPFFHILHLLQTQIVAFMYCLYLFASFPFHSKKLVQGTFLNLKHVHGHDLNRKCDP